MNNPKPQMTSTCGKLRNLIQRGATTGIPAVAWRWYASELR